MTFLKRGSLPNRHENGTYVRLKTTDQKLLENG